MGSLAVSPTSKRFDAVSGHWHREKAGTAEMANDILKSDLGAGALPSKYFGANAA